MSLAAALQFAVFLLIVTLGVRPLGSYLFCVFNHERTLLDPFLAPVERLAYRLCGVNIRKQMAWGEYAASFLIFATAGTVLLYGVLRLQSFLPFYFREYTTTKMTPDLAMNTAISFSTATTWQAYAGETTLSYTSQIFGLAVQNILAGASGLAVGIAFIRGFAQKHSTTIGNFWVDLLRAVLWVLVPATLVGVLLLVWQGVPLNWNPYVHATTLEGREQVIPQGPVAILEFTKNIGTNGGGFFNANGAHPLANPTPLSNVIGMLAIAQIPAALTYTFGIMVRNKRQGWVLYWVMVAIFSLSLILGQAAEQRRNPALAGVDQRVSSQQPGGNMEGKEVRFGIAQSVLTAVTTSAGASGSYNSMHDSYMPLGGLVPLVNMLLGELSFGGLGTGIFSLIMVLLLGVFLAGLMVGRTPEYLGKKITPTANKMIMLYTLAAPIVVLMLTAIAVIVPQGLQGLTTNHGPHGLTSILYAYTSSFGNNGQNFAGLNGNAFFYNVTTAMAMMAGRFLLAIPALALAGEFARQGHVPETRGTLRTDSFMFGVFLLICILALTGLAFFPVLTLGPVLEHLLMH